MKMKKVLAAALAGTMVFAMTVPVLAAGPTHVKPVWECWWNGPVDTDGDGEAEYTLTDEEYDAKFVNLDDLKGDGTWSIAIKCTPTDLGEEQMYTFTGDVWSEDGDTSKWISYGTHGDIWGDATVSGQNTSVEPALVGDDIVTFTINRVGSEFAVDIAKNGTPFLKFKATDAQVTGDTIHTRVCVQYGEADIYPVVEGDAQAAIDAVNSSSSGSEEKTQQTADKTTGGDATSGSTAGTTGSGSAGSSSSGSTTTTPKTGDATPIVAILVAVAGCGAVAFASKKRFAK